jgi:hypothetical protein
LKRKQTILNRILLFWAFEKKQIISKRLFWKKLFHSKQIIFERVCLFKTFFKHKQQKRNQIRSLILSWNKNKWFSTKFFYFNHLEAETNDFRKILFLKLLETETIKFGTKAINLKLFWNWNKRYLGYFLQFAWSKNK